MTFISYAQNFEDVMLARALRSVEKGFYVDVGAQHPTEHSVTRAFYDLGWSGINLEPVTQWHQLLCEQRPRDINLKVAIGNRAGSLKFYSIEGTGLSTADADIAETHRKGGWTVSESEVQVKTLASVMEENRVQEIHFLKVDVEGLEKQVLEGADFARFRPWIVLVEATRPLSLDQNHQAWEPLVVNAGYTFAYFDGLNRFYVADEHSELMSAFVAPPNCFDPFVRQSEWHAHKLADERGHLAHHFSALAQDLSERLESARLHLEQAAEWHTKERQLLERDLHWNQKELSRVQEELRVLSNSFSWKITIPVRLMGRGWRRLKRGLLRILIGAARMGFRAGSRIPVIRHVFIKLRDRLLPDHIAHRLAMKNDQLKCSDSAKAFVSLYREVEKARTSDKQAERTRVPS